jgi:hypothetical protein
VRLRCLQPLQAFSMSGVTGGGVLEVVWPGVSTLLGALVGGGVTLWANLQKNSQEKRASDEGRKRLIKDRSFKASVDILKAGRLLFAAGNMTWYKVYVRATHGHVDEAATTLERTLRDWYSAAEVVRLTVPPEAEPAFEDYAKVLGHYVACVRERKHKYLQRTLPDTELESDYEPDQAFYNEFNALEDDIIAKRDTFIKVVKKEFDDGTYSAK